MKILVILLSMIISIPAYSHSGPDVPNPKNLRDLVAAFGWDFEKTKITTETVADDLHVLFGVGGNIAVNVGEDGVFIVDDQFPQMMPKIRDAIAKLGGNEVDFAVNTHWHFDHAEGNLTLGQSGTWLVAHENSREMMMQDNIVNLVVAAYDQQAYPEHALPDITFDDDMKFHLNGQTIELWHFGPAHTTGDAAIYFSETNAVHLGDVFNNRGYPFIDAGNGGSMEGVIRFSKKTLARINKDTVVIPGHGPISNYQGLADYVTMLTTVKDRMLKLIDEGATLEEVIAAKVTADYDKKRGANTLFINRAYMSLTHKRVN